LILILAIGGIWWSASTTPSGFVPDEDRGLIFVNLELPAGASIDRTQEVNDLLYQKVKDVEGVQGVSVIAGRSLISGAGSNYGLGFIKLDNWEERDTDELSIESITGKLFGIAATIPEANIIFFSPPSIPGFGNSSGFEVNLLDRSGSGFNELDEANQEFIRKLSERPEIQYAQSSFNTNYPQYELELNVPLAKEKRSYGK